MRVSAPNGNGFGTSTTTDGTLDTLNRSLSGQQLGDALDHVLGKPEGNSVLEIGPAGKYARIDMIRVFLFPSDS